MYSLFEKQTMDCAGFENSPNPFLQAPPLTYICHLSWYNGLHLMGFTVDFMIEMICRIWIIRINKNKIEDSMPPWTKLWYGQEIRYNPSFIFCFSELLRTKAQARQKQFKKAYGNGMMPIGNFQESNQIVSGFNLINAVFYFFYFTVSS